MTSQTFQDIEILVSDNCSPNPEVQRIAQRYAVRDSRIKVFRQTTNIGRFDNHQFVKDQARGKYFMWAHDDDEFPTNYVEICLAHFKDAPDVVLVGPSCDRYLDGKYFLTPENYSSIGLSTYERLRNLMPDGLRRYWRFEQYFSGLCLLSAAPTYFSKDCGGEFYHFFVLSERGTLAHAPELKIIKHTTQEQWDSYEAGSEFRELPILRYFSFSNIQAYTPLAGQMIATIWRSRRLTGIEKIQLTSHCISLYSAYPLRNEFQDRIIPRSRKWIGENIPFVRRIYRGFKSQL